MASLYEDLWNIWQDIGDGPLIQYSEVEAVSDNNAFGLRENLYDTSPRAEILDELNETTGNWWNGRSGTAFQQGVYIEADSASETLSGTNAEDFILGGAGDDFIFGFADDDGLHGGAGNDTLSGGAGSDTIVGGAGTDTAHYAGNYADYIVSSDDQTVVVTYTPNGDIDRLTEVEELSFDDATYDTATGTVTFSEPPVEPTTGLDIQSLNFSSATSSEIQATETLTRSGAMDGAAYFVKSIDADNVLLANDDAALGAGNYQVANLHGLDTALANGTIETGLSLLSGSNFDDRIKGRKHNETFEGLGGNDRIDGGGGFDVAVYDGAIADYFVSQNGNGVRVTHTPSGDSDRLFKIEQLTFDDGIIDTADIFLA